MSLFDFFINDDVRAVVESLDSEPEAWKPLAFGGTLYTLTHRPSGLRVWAANRAYGVEITGIWGGVGDLSSLGLSIPHWALSNAIGRWLRANPIPVPIVSAILAGDYFHA